MHLSASSEGQCQWHKALPLIICTMTLRPVYPRLCFRGKCKAFKYFIMPARADSVAWQMGGQPTWAQAEPKTRGWVWLTLKSGSASRDATSREAPNQATNEPTSSSFSCRCSCSNFCAPCSLFTVTPTCIAYSTSLPSPSCLSVSFWSDWNKFNFICSRSVSQRTAAAEQRSPHRLNTKLYFDAYLWGA